MNYLCCSFLKDLLRKCALIIYISLSTELSACNYNYIHQVWSPNMQFYFDVLPIGVKDVQLSKGNSIELHGGLDQIRHSGCQQGFLLSENEIS